MLCLTLSHWFKSKEQVHTNQKIYVYNWGEYIDPELIKKFEKKRAYRSFMKLSIQTKRWKPKIRNGGTHYDVAFPSEYTVQKIEKRSFIVTNRS